LANSPPLVRIVVRASGSKLVARKGSIPADTELDVNGRFSRQNE